MKKIICTVAIGLSIMAQAETECIDRRAALIEACAEGAEMVFVQGACLEPYEFERFYCTPVASLKKVYSTQPSVPFECKNASLAVATADLAKQCGALNLNLVKVQEHSCVPSGDDGAYVNYLKVTFEGFCG